MYFATNEHLLNILKQYLFILFILGISVNACVFPSYLGCAGSLSAQTTIAAGPCYTLWTCE